MIRVESETLTSEELKEKRKKVELWQNYGYSKMAIFYFLGQNYSVTGTYDNEEFVITLA